MKARHIYERVFFLLFLGPAFSASLFFFLFYGLGGPDISWKAEGGKAEELAGKKKKRAKKQGGRERKREKRPKLATRRVSRYPDMAAKVERLQ